MNAPYVPPYIPPKIDVQQILIELKTAGWCDYKLEMACGMGNRYIAHLRAGDIDRISLEYAARLYNLWIDECVIAGTSVLTVAETST